MTKTILSDITLPTTCTKSKVKYQKASNTILCIRQDYKFTSKDIQTYFNTIRKIFNVAVQ